MRELGFSNCLGIRRWEKQHKGTYMDSRNWPRGRYTRLSCQVLAPDVRKSSLQVWRTRAEGRKEEKGNGYAALQTVITAAGP